MALDWRSIEESLINEDVESMTNALTNLSVNGSSKEASQSVIDSAMDKLGHQDVVLRSGAVLVLSQCVASDNPILKGSMEDLCRAIATSNILDLKSGKENFDEYVLLHKNLCTMISDLQRKHPESLMPYFKPIGAYLVNCTGSNSRVVALAVCEYWAQLLVPPVPSHLMDYWVPAILSKLAKLLPNLLKNIAYHEEHVKYLEMNTQDTEGRETPVSMEEYTNLRNYSALGLETMCRIFQTEAVIIFKPMIERWLRSTNWKEQEAMTLALGALIEAVGTPRELKDVYPKVIAKLLEFYSHPKPLVRSITCFTMQHFINVDPKVLSVKDPYTKMLKCTLTLISDNNREVQEMAVQSLSALLAFSNRDIQPYSKKLIDELVKADAVLKGRARNTYYECISHMFGHMGALLDESQVSKLMGPLMDQWKILSNSDQQEIMMLGQSFCVVATFSKSSFSPFNEEILKKAVPYLEHAVEQNDLEGDKVTTHTVTFLDILSAMFEGQGRSMSTFLSKYHLTRILLHILGESKFQGPVHQSGLALLGHICQHCYSNVHPHLDLTLTTLHKHVDSKESRIQNNVLWCLAHIAVSCPDANNQLLDMSKKISKILMRKKTEEGVAINAALALTSLGERWPDAMAEVILKDDTFIHICGLLQQTFPRDLEKVNIFTNLCDIISVNMKDISNPGWVQFCIAAAVLDCHNAALSQKLKTLLRDLRVKQGNSGWSKISQSIGSQLSYSLRKKYKLY